MEDESRGSQEIARLELDAGATREAASARLQQLEAELEQAAERASRALAMLEAGDVERAREELALVAGAASEPVACQPPVLGPVHALASAEPAPVEVAPLGASQEALVPPLRLDFDDQLGDDELDLAFASAESDVDQMHDANRVAERVLEEADPGPGLDARNVHPVFATETMAELLEGQGHPERAQAIRNALHVAAPQADESGGIAAWDEMDAYAETWPGDLQVGAEAVYEAPPVAAASNRTLATLELWLDNVRRDVA